MSVIDRFNRMDGTAPVVDPFNSPAPDVPYSRFNYSNIQTTNAIIGALHPLQPIETVPFEKFNISVNILAMVRNPLVRRLLSGMRLYVHFYYMRFSDVWEGAENFFTHGRSGNINLEIPYLLHNFTYKDGKVKDTFTPLAPSDTMGLPIVSYDSSDPLNCFNPHLINDETSVGSSNLGKINALYFAMYKAICIDKYFNKNLLFQNKTLYPDNPDDLILPYSATGVDSLSRTSPTMFSEFASSNNSTPKFGSRVFVPQNNNDSFSYGLLNILHFRQWKGDYFTSASPFVDLLRGSTPTIDLTSITGSIDWSDVTASLSDPQYHNVVVDSHNSTLGASLSQTTLGAPVKAALDKARINAIAQASISLKNLRELEAFTLFKERNARTDGDYNNLIKAQFGKNPHAYSRKPIYLGGTYQDIVFSEVTQNSASSADGTPLGTVAGRGISAGSSFIGSFEAPDYGAIIPILSIVPDVYYTQGVPRMFSKLTPEEQYFPIFNNLSAQAILNKELFVTGNESVDNDVYGYAERFSEFKSRQNIVSGLIKLPHSKADYDASLVLARRFNNTVHLNNQNVTMFTNNVDMSVFSNANEPPFDVSVASIIDRVSPLPFVTVPGGLSARG